MKNKILWILTLIQMIITCLVLPTMKEIVPKHYDLYGNIDRWGSKYENLLLPITIIITTLVCTLLMKYLRNKQEKLKINNKSEKSIQEAKQNETVIYYTALAMVILFGVMQLAFLYSAIIESENNMQTMAIDINVVINSTLGIFLIVIGYAMTKCKLNSLFGLRTLWSMKDEETWEKSNRFAGISLAICGIVVIIESIIIRNILSIVIMILILIIDAIISTVYSYRVYKRKVNSEDK